MNKNINWNTVVGLLLIGAIFLWFGYFNQPETAADDGQTPADSAEVVEETEDLVDDLPLEELDSTHAGDVLQPAQNAEVITLENDVLELGISTKGGQIVEARLKDFYTHDSLPLYLIRDHNAEFNIQLKGDKTLNTADLSFKAERVSDTELNMVLNAGNGKSLTYHYSLEPSNYMLNWTIESQGMRDMLSGAGLQWEMRTFSHEKNIDRERQYTRIKYSLADEDDVEELSASGEDDEEATSVKWVADKQQYFTSILLNKTGTFKQAAMASQSLDEDSTFTKYMLSKVSLGDGTYDLNQPLGLYLGPNKYDVLESYNHNFEELIPLGWGILGWINRGIVINVFNWLEHYGLNYGLIILIIALLIKIILFPFTYTSYRSMAKMRVLKPEMDALNEKYKDKDPMKKQQATMELYQKAGVNPLGGCIPMLFQMPVLIAMFRFFPASIELRQQPFLWADDLSTYDSIFHLPFAIPFYGDHVSLFTLLMTVSTLLYTWMNQQLTGSNQQYPQLKYMVYLMPIVFMGVLNSYPAALSYYYFVANMITFGQQYAIRAFIDEDKIHAKIQERKQKPGKQNRLMRRMREMQEEQDQNRQSRRSKK